MIGEVMYVDNFGIALPIFREIILKKQLSILIILKLTSEIFYSKIFIENTPIL
jgi:hypothetical protein